MTTKLQFIIVAFVVTLLSASYQYLLYPQLLTPLSSAQNLHTIQWLSDLSTTCPRVSTQTGCVLHSGSSSQRFVASINLNSAQSQNSVVQYAMKWKVNSLGVLKSAHVKAVLISVKNAKRQWKMPHYFFSSHQQKSHSDRGYLYFSEPFEGFQLVFELGVGQEVEIESLSIIHLKESPANQVIQTILYGLWLGVFLFLMFVIFQEKNCWNWPLVLIVVIIVLGTQLPNSMFNPIKDWLKTTYATWQEQSIQQRSSIIVTSSLEPPVQVSDSSEIMVLTFNPVILVKKIAHIFLFALLSLFLWFWLNHKAKLFMVLFLSGFMAVITEVLQALGKVRSPSMIDIGLDMLGVCISLIMAYVLFRQKNVVQRS